MISRIYPLALCIQDHLSVLLPMLIDKLVANPFTWHVRSSVAIRMRLVDRFVVQLFR